MVLARRGAVVGVYEEYITATSGLTKRFDDDIYRIFKIGPNMQS